MRVMTLFFLTALLSGCINPKIRHYDKILSNSAEAETALSVFVPPIPTPLAQPVVLGLAAEGQQAFVEGIM